VIVAERDFYRYPPYYERYEEYRQKHSIQKPKPNNKKGRYILILALIGFIFLFLLSRFCAINETKYKIEKMKAELKNYEIQNERLKVEIAKLKSISRIEKIAKTELNMVEPESNQIIYLSKN
jgi:cell division protein FtsL